MESVGYTHTPPSRSRIFNFVKIFVYGFSFSIDLTYENSGMLINLIAIISFGQISLLYTRLHLPATDSVGF